MLLYYNLNILNGYKLGLGFMINGVIGLICKKVKVIRSCKSEVELVLYYLILIIKMGTIFNYEKQGSPDVLFSSDSNFVFIGRRRINRVFYETIWDHKYLYNGKRNEGTHSFLCRGEDYFSCFILGSWIGSSNIS